MAGSRFRHMRNLNTPSVAVASPCKKNFMEFRQRCRDAGKATARLCRGGVKDFGKLYDERGAMGRKGIEFVGRNKDFISTGAVVVATTSLSIRFLFAEPNRKRAEAMEGLSPEGKKLGKACDRLLEKVNGKAEWAKESMWESEFRIWTMLQAGMKQGEIRNEILSDAYMGNPELAQAMDTKELDLVIESMRHYQPKYRVYEQVRRETSPDYFIAAGLSFSNAAVSLFVMYLAWTRGEKALACFRGMLGRFRLRQPQGAGEAEGVGERGSMAHGDKAA